LGFSSTGFSAFFFSGAGFSAAAFLAGLFFSEGAFTPKAIGVVLSLTREASLSE